MELEIISKKENPLLDRVEVNFKVTHLKENTPKRKDIRDVIAEELSVPKDRIVIDHMNTEFGKPETMGYAKVYKKKEAAQQIETKAVLKRNNLYEGKKDKDEKKEEAKEG